MKTDENCCCHGWKGHKMERFMEVCLLLLLAGDEGHGYGLMEQLTLFGFEAAQLNVSTLYRSLRKMEKEGMVISRWEAGGPGPKRRVYSITDHGREELNRWIEVLQQRKRRIEGVIKHYEAYKNTR